MGGGVHLNQFTSIRQWGGSQASAWEELAYQLRDREAPGVVETRRTRAPDAGVEWCGVYDDGHEEGHQAKYYDSLADAIGDMRGSVEAVARHRPKMNSLTFVVPFNLTDNPGRKTDRKRWEDAKARWAAEIPNADEIAFRLDCASDVLDRLSRAEHAGRRAFWFSEFELPADRLDGWLQAFRASAGDRYTPEANADLGLSRIAQMLIVDTGVRERITAELDTVAERMAGVTTLAQVPADWASRAGALPRSLENVEVGGWEEPLQALVAWSNTVRECLDELERTVVSNDSPWGERSAVQALRSELGTLERSVRGPWQVAGPGQCLVLAGRGGAGKTHFVADSVGEMLESGTPAVAVSGTRFSDGPWWHQLAAVLGIDVDLDVFLGALNAYGEAAGRRAVIAIDAINESQDPWRWCAELPDLVANVRRFDHLALLVTVRVEYLDGIVRDAIPDVPVAEHHGVRWEDRNAIFEAYQRFYGVEVPNALRRDPAFDLPLLVKLACQLYASDDPPDGPVARNDLFRAWVADRQRHINKQLKLEPTSSAAQRAVKVIARGVLRSPTQEVGASELRKTVNDLVTPGRQGWPWTLFDQLREAGVIDVIPSNDDDGSEVVRFPYETISSYLLVDQLMSDAAAGTAQDAAKILSASPGLWAAAASVVPERTGAELPALLRGHDAPEGAPDLDLLFAFSLLHRSTAAISPAACSDFAKLLTGPPVAPEVVDVVLQLAAREHPLNADWLHDQLAGLSMAERDASWGIGSYDSHQDQGVDGLLRVLRDDTASQQARARAFVTIAWFLETPNRHARDTLTKELTTAAIAAPALLATALEAFLDVDAPYAIERLLLVTYGALMQGDRTGAEHEELVQLVQRARTRKLLPVNVLVDDHVRGILEWAADQGLPHTIDQVPAVGDHEPPDDAPSEEELERRHRRDGPEPAVTILLSCLTWMGDFHKYVMQSAVETFAPVPLGGRSIGAVRADGDTVDMSWAGRWVAARAIEFGWTAERFEEFERSRRDDPGRAAHKAERFGKKYQWLAFHELTARLAANLQVRAPYSDSPTEYRGPWQWYGRDIDPTLQPSEYAGGLEAPNGAIDFSDVSAGTVDVNTPASVQEWVQATGEFPTPDALLAGHGQQMLTLFRFEKWTRSAERGIDRDQWVICQAWCVRSADLGRASEYIRQKRADWGRWIPAPDREHHSYLGEGPWATVRQEEGWIPLRDWEDDIDVDVLPATRGYLWEGGTTRDCSLDSGVNLQLPATQLTQGLQFRADSVTYRAGEDVVARASRGRESGQLTSIDQVWLDRRLAEMDAGIVISVIGERRANDDPTGNWRGESCGTELWLVATYDPAGGLRHQGKYDSTEWPSKRGSSNQAPR